MSKISFNSSLSEKLVQIIKNWHQEEVDNKMIGGKGYISEIG